MKKQPTIILGSDGIEYVVSGGKIVEKCLHKTTRDESTPEIHRVVCHVCGKVNQYSKKNTLQESGKSSLQEFQDNFKAMHGRYPKGIELSQMF